MNSLSGAYFPPGGAVWRGICVVASPVVRAGRGAVLHAGFRPADVCDVSGGNNLYLSGAEF